MEIPELLRHIVVALDGLRVRYLITGSMATIAYGEPRLTNDIDIVVDLPSEQVEAFCRCFPSPEEFNRSRLGRAVRLRAAADLTASFAAPEDAILKKMEYYREGGAEKHLRDIAGVLKISGGRLDFAYLESWSQKLGVSEIWRQIRESAPHLPARPLTEDEP